MTDQVNSHRALAYQWAQLALGSVSLSHESVTSLLEKGGGVEARRLAASGDLEAATMLLRLSAACLGMPSLEQAPDNRPSLGSNELLLTQEMCFGYFGNDVAGATDLKCLQLQWGRLIAESGFRPAAAYYWQLLDAAGLVHSIDTASDFSTCDHHQTALSLLIAASESGDFNATYALLDAHLRGHGVPRDEKLASKYAAMVIAIDSATKRMNFIGESMSNVYGQRRRALSKT